VRDLCNHVIEALDVLNVNGRVDIDAVGQQFFDVEITLGVTAAGCIGMGEFIDKNNLRPARDDPVKVHLLEPLALVINTPPRDDFEAVQEGLRFPAAWVSTTPTTMS